MENHPIPQDITGFQFKLIGDMTIKQFAYLASGTVVAWIIFSLPISYFFRFPFAAIFVFFGVSFAFLSIEGRPMDTMIINFIRATFSPTKYIYQAPNFNMSYQTPNQKINEEINFNPVPQIKTQPQQNELDKKEFDFFHMLSQMLHPQSHPQVSQTDPSSGAVSRPFVVTAHVQGEKKVEHHEKPQEEQKASDVEKLEEETLELKNELKAAVEEEKATEGTPSFEDTHKKVLEIENILSETLMQKQSLEKEIMNLKKQLEMQKKDVYTPSRSPQPAQTPNVRTIINKAQGKSAGLPTIPEFPNIITGILKDPRGNPLQNILVEVKDTAGNPVRAFKTNPLGQFGASTPLSNGDYTIEFEDPKGMNKFDAVAFTATGEIISPIEVLSIDTREELRKSLFN